MRAASRGGRTILSPALRRTNHAGSFTILRRGTGMLSGTGPVQEPTHAETHGGHHGLPVEIAHRKRPTREEQWEGNVTEKILSSRVLYYPI